MGGKVLFFALPSVICLSLVATIALAAASLSLDKTHYKTGEAITVTVSDVSEQMEADGAWVGIYKKDATHGEYGEYKYIKTGTSAVELEVPEYGIYEVRLYSKSIPYDDTTFVAKVPFMAIGGAVDPTSSAISLNKAKVYAAGEKILITTSGITRQMVEDKMFVAIYKPGAAHNQWGPYAYLGEGSGQVELAAPQESGLYEIRLYRKDGEYTNETFVTKVPFNVITISLGKKGATGERSEACPP